MVSLVSHVGHLGAENVGVESGILLSASLSMSVRVGLRKMCVEEDQWTQ